MSSIGPQYEPDDDFNAAARLHQSAYRCGLVDGEGVTLAGLHLPKTTESYRLTVFRLPANPVLYDHPSLYGCFDHRTESIFFEVNTSAQSPLRLDPDRIICSFVSGRRVNHAGLRSNSIAIRG